MSEEDIGKFDGLLMTCLQQGGGIINFFDSIFGFLQRKSDFFADEKQSRSYVEVHYNKWLKKHQEKIEKEKKIRQRKEEEEKAKKKPTETSSATVKEITPEEYERKMKEEQEKAKNPQPEPEPKKEEKKEDKDKEEDDGDKLQEGHIMPNKEKGANLEKYNWAQMDIKEITITFNVPNSIRGKDLKIECTNTHLYVGINGQPPIIDSELCEQIKSDTMIWQLEEVKDGKLCTVNFEKYTPTWWECVEKNDPVKVDTRKIHPETTSLSDIEDPSLKAQVEKMMFDQRQKAMGKPPSDILQKAPQIEEFMRRHPEMDFSKTQWG